MIRKFNKRCVRYTEILDSGFDLIRSHQQDIPIEAAAKECRVKTQPLSHWYTSYTSAAKLTSHGKRATT